MSLFKKLLVPNNYRKLFFVILLSLLILPTQNSAQAQAYNAPAPGILQLQQLIVRIISFVSTFAFIALIIMFVYAGIRFITSNGEPKNIQAAQQIVTWAVIGTACLVLAYVILLIIGSFTGVNLTGICLNFDDRSQCN